MKEEKRSGKPKKILHFAGIALITAGLILAFFPFFNNLYSRYVENEAEANPDITVNKDAQIDAAENYPATIEPKKSVLEIPALEVKANIVYGVEKEDLKKGPGFYPQSGWPDNGNVCIAGHRATYGGYFRNLDKLKAGDRIILTYNGKDYLYSVEKVFITEDTDWSIIEPTPKPALTLTTCDPPYEVGTTKRLVVRAYLVEKPDYTPD